jgi:hypothetical protein
MDAYYTTPVGPFATAIGANFNTFTARQFVDPLPVPVLAPNQLRPGSKLKIEAEWEYSTTGTPTLVIGCALGILGATGSLGTPIVLAETRAITTPSAAASFSGRLEYRGIVTAVGTAGSITGSGQVDFSTSLTVNTSEPIPTTLALRTVAIDTTIQRGIGIVATWGTSSVSNNIRVYNVSALLLN